MRIDTGIASYRSQSLYQAQATQASATASVNEAQKVDADTDSASISERASELFDSQPLNTQDAIPPDEPLTGNGDGNP
ncbi:hypothetical protein [Acanthopleuribacter pedis]|uniref:Uncharacterized protein n=1 Tax=Acanthopleuribacter pedis TaxID=442870 RepID=A0A8J7QLL1_9BACT|nr:hypothetical protein [Acanthopleuribacter pedis]MBO1323411.1 hypothetical protein [Acanthopleuribacter pedis]